MKTIQAIQASQKPTTEPTLLRAKEVAAILKVSVSQAYKMMKSGDLPVVQICRSVRVWSSDLDEYLKSCRLGRPLFRF